MRRQLRRSRTGGTPTPDDALARLVVPRQGWPTAAHRTTSAREIATEAVGSFGLPLARSGPAWSARRSRGAIGITVPCVRATTSASRRQGSEFRIDLTLIGLALAFVGLPLTLVGLPVAVVGVVVAV